MAITDLKPLSLYKGSYSFFLCLKSKLYRSQNLIGVGEGDKGLGKCSVCVHMILNNNNNFRGDVLPHLPLMTGATSRRALAKQLKELKGPNVYYNTRMVYILE